MTKHITHHGFENTMKAAFRSIHQKPQPEPETPFKTDAEYFRNLDVAFQLEDEWILQETIKATPEDVFYRYLHTNEDDI